MKTRAIVSIAAAGSLLAAAAVVTTSWIGASAAGSELRIHIGTDGARVSYPGQPNQILTVGKNSCAIANPSGPNTNPTAGTLLRLGSTSGSGNSAPGMANYGLGVKASPSSGNGSPCAQIDSAESLTLTPGSAIGGVSFDSARLDLEVTGNAVALVTLSGGSAPEPTTFTLITGNAVPSGQGGSPPFKITTTSSLSPAYCAAGNSSNPNNAGSDNCLWTIQPGFSFTTIRLGASAGTVTLEGSADFGNDPNYDTLFNVSNAAPSVNPDSASVNRNGADIFTKQFVDIDVLGNDTDDQVPKNLTIDSFTQPAKGTTTLQGTKVRYTPANPPAGQTFPYTDTFTYTARDGQGAVSGSATVTVTINSVTCEEAPHPEPAGQIWAQFYRLDDEVVSCKHYVLSVDNNGSTVLFDPSPAVAGEPLVAYRGIIELGPKAAPGTNGQLNLLLRYDPDDTGPQIVKPVQWCDSPTFDENWILTGASLPSASETWCIASESTRGQGTDNVVTTWQVYGFDDPRFQ